MINFKRCLLIFSFSIISIGCAETARIGMVRDSSSGVQLGSVVEKNIFVDASQFKNRSIKITTRNSSGDPAYQLGSFTEDLNMALSRKGYKPTMDDTFGLKMDINVLYSGQIQRNLAAEYGFIGATAGGIAGYRSNTSAGTAAGMLVGATLGSVLGASITDETYIVVAEVSLGVTDSVEGGLNGKRTITFGSSPKLQEDILSANFMPFREVLRTKVAVYAGGRNINQAQIVEQVRWRLVSVVGDTI